MVTPPSEHRGSLEIGSCSGGGGVAGIGRFSGAPRCSVNCTFIAEIEYEKTTEGIACAPENQWSGRTCSVTEKTFDGVSVPLRARCADGTTLIMYRT